MDFRDLEAFVAVARREHFSRAAAQLRVAQSALSRRVDRLEHLLGTKLLERRGRGVRLTDAGRVLLTRSEALIRELSAVEADIQTLAKEPTGYVRLALPPATSEVLSPLLVIACRKKFPRITLHIREGYSGAIHEWLLAGEVDVAVYYSPKPAPEIEIVPLLDEPLCVVLPAQTQVDNESVFPVRKLIDLPLIMPARPHSLRHVVERYTSDHGFQPRIDMEIDGIRTIRSIVSCGLGCTIFSYAEIADGIEAGLIKAIPLEPQLNWRLSMVRKKSLRSSRATEEIQALIVEQISTLLQRRLWTGKLLTPIAD